LSVFQEEILLSFQTIVLVSHEHFVFSFSNCINCFVHVFHNVEFIVYYYRIRNMRFDPGSVCLPEIHTDSLHTLLLLCRQGFPDGIDRLRVAVLRNFKDSLAGNIRKNRCASMPGEKKIFSSIPIYVMSSSFRRFIPRSTDRFMMPSISAQLMRSKSAAF